MTDLLTVVAASASSDGPVIHVAPAVIFHIGSFGVTNSMFYGWIVSLLLIGVFVRIAQLVTIRPKGGVVQLVEAGASFIGGVVENAFDQPEKGRKYIPFFVTVFFFILLTNWLGLIPGVGEAFTSSDQPLFRPFTADLNGTLAVGLITMFVVYAASIKESGGVGKYFRHFFLGSPWNPLYLVIGILEMFTDLTRVLSLSLRLFLNVTIGEIIIAVFAFLGGFLAPAVATPFVLLELFVGFLQAYIFTMLSIMYLAIAVNHGHDEAQDATAGQGLTDGQLPGKMELQS